MNKVTYVQGSALPDLVINWYNSQKVLIDFTTGYNFQLKIGKPGETALVTKTGGFIASLTSPNITIQWAIANELSTLSPGVYRAQLKAIRSADNKPRILEFDLEVVAAVL